MSITFQDFWKEKADDLLPVLPHPFVKVLLCRKAPRRAELPGGGTFL